MLDVHHGTDVTVQGLQSRRQRSRDSGQGQQEVDAGHLGAGHIAGWTVHAGVVAAPGTLPPLDVALGEEIDGSAHAPDAWIEVLFFVTQGQEMRIAQSPFVLWMLCIGADGLRLISEGALPILGSAVKARS